MAATTSTNYVILDCDGGSDDAWALVLLLKADAIKLIKLLAVTICGNGNTSLNYAARNMLMILRSCNRMDVSIDFLIGSNATNIIFGT